MVPGLLPSGEEAPATALDTASAAEPDETPATITRSGRLVRPHRYSDMKSVNELLNVRAQFWGSRTPEDSSAECSSGPKEGAHSATPVSPRNSSLPTVMSKVTVAEASANAVSGAEASAKASDAEAPAEASDAEALAKASGAEASAEANDSEASARLKGEGEGGSEPHEATVSDNDEELHDRLLEDDVEMKGETDC
ncbi:uncharacterized protein [Watersipora subatra]|uniref:uncharacterized protein n=1 Tax=Watersipora subatra TaxID=2589382 RepID=UPI00355C43B2